MWVLSWRTAQHTLVTPAHPDQLISQINWVPSLHTPTRELCIKYLAQWTSIFVILQAAEGHNSTGRMQAKIHIQRVQPCACKFYIGLTSKADRLTGSGVKIPSWLQAGLWQWRSFVQTSPKGSGTRLCVLCQLLWILIRSSVGLILLGSQQLQEHTGHRCALHVILNLGPSDTPSSKRPRATPLRRSSLDHERRKACSKSKCGFSTCFGKQHPDIPRIFKN